MNELVLNAEIIADERHQLASYLYLLLGDVPFCQDVYTYQDNS